MLHSGMGGWVDVSRQEPPHHSPFLRSHRKGPSAQTPPVPTTGLTSCIHSSPGSELKRVRVSRSPRCHHRLHETPGYPAPTQTQLPRCCFALPLLPLLGPGSKRHPNSQPDAHSLGCSLLTVFLSLRKATAELSRECNGQSWSFPIQKQEATSTF